MKNFKRLLAAGVAAVMVFALAGCGSKELVQEVAKEAEKAAAEMEEEVTLPGEWVSGKINMIDAFAEGADPEMKENIGTDISIKDYVTAINLLGHLTFNEDGTFSLSYTLDSDREALISEFAEYMRAIYNEMNGEPFTDEEFAEMLGTDLESYAAEAWSDEAAAEYFPENQITGNYVFENGMVTITADESGDSSTGTLEGGELLMEDDELGTLVFTKK